MAYTITIFEICLEFLSQPLLVGPDGIISASSQFTKEFQYVMSKIPFNTFDLKNLEWISSFFSELNLNTPLGTLGKQFQVQFQAALKDGYFPTVESIMSFFFVKICVRDRSEITLDWTNLSFMFSNEMIGRLCQQLMDFIHSRRI